MSYQPKGEVHPFEVEGKERHSVSVPPPLQAFMREVFLDIEYPDPDILERCGFQWDCDWGYGGMDEDDPEWYVFTYFPEHNQDHSWRLRLHRVDIEDIGDGILTEIKLWFCPATECHFGYSEEDALCPQCDHPNIH